MAHIHTGELLELGALYFRSLVMDPRQAARQQAQIVVRQVAVRDLLQQFIQRNVDPIAAFRLRRMIGHLVLGNSNGVYEEKLVFGIRIGRDVPQGIIRDFPTTASSHLNIKRLGIDIPHEKQYFQRFYIGSRGHQCHSDSNPERLVIAETLDESVAVPCGISDLLGELGALPRKHLFPDNLDDVICVRVAFGEDQRFRDISEIGFPIGIHVPINCAFECIKNQPDLFRIDYRSIKIGRQIR